MSKPLELKLYSPKGEPDEDCGNCDGRGCMGCVFREYDHDCRNDCPMCCERNFPASKHFSDGELAAEYWRLACDLALGIYTPFSLREVITDDMAETVERFATTPHYEDRP